jgi:hypothetical protein
MDSTEILELVKDGTLEPDQVEDFEVLRFSLRSNLRIFDHLYNRASRDY